jgi:hypothetical protein
LIAASRSNGGTGGRAVMGFLEFFRGVGRPRG